MFLDENECNEIRSPCDLNADCINTDGSFECECKSGFVGDGLRCERGRSTIEISLNYSFYVDRWPRPYWIISVYNKFEFNTVLHSNAF